MKARHVALGILLLGLVAQPAAAQKVRRERYRITAEEIATRPGAANAYDVIKALRPAWLTSSRGVGSSGDAIVVYVDGVRIGYTDDLQSIDVATLKELRFVAPTDATTRYGTGHSAGAIEITTNR